MKFIGVSIALALAAALPAQAQEAAWPRALTHASGELTIPAQPQRVVSTAPSLTGILLAIGVPLKASAAAVIGPLTDDKGFFKQWADVADERGVEVLYPNLAFDLEAVILADADLVVGSVSGGDAILPALAELKAQEIPVFMADYADHSWQELAEELGRATGHEEGAAAAIRDFDEKTAAAAAAMTIPPGRTSIVSYDFSGTYAVSTPLSPQARVLEALGFTVAGLPESMAPQVVRRSDFDFVSHENLPPAIQGETVFLLNGTEAAVARFKADPVLANLPAVKEGRVYPLGPTSFRVDYYSGLQIVETVKPFFLAP